MTAIDRKRANIDGAALFSTLPRKRNENLLKLLVGYEVLADYLDCTSERSAYTGIATGLHLHLALSDAVNPHAPQGDYYGLNPWRDDNGYAGKLVYACQSWCARLPSFESVRTVLLTVAGLTQVLALNHVSDAQTRDLLLAWWAARSSGSIAGGLVWWEQTGAASAWLTVFALLAVAAERQRLDVGSVTAAYLPWISLAGTMLDSFVDIAEDVGAHSYISHYPSSEVASERVAEVVREALLAAGALHNGYRHRVVVCCMVAMYLSKDSARQLPVRRDTLRLAQAGGSLARVLLPVLRLWRVIYRQQTA